MADREPIAWITMNGVHVPIFEGESKQDAYKRRMKEIADKNSDDKEKQINSNKKEADDKNIFPDSKVQETLYHGSNKDFDKFDTSKSIEGNNALFFADDKDYAESIAEERGGKNIFEVKLDIKKPLKVSLSAKEFSDPRVEKKYIEKAKKDGYDSVIFKNSEPDEYNNVTFYAVFNPNQVYIKNKGK